MTRFTLIIILLSLSTLGGKAQNNLLFKHLNIQDGLPSNEINDIIKDTTGFIWIASQNGLTKYDGNKFKNYFFEENNPNSIVNNTIHDLFIDSKGNLWIGTNNGLCRYDPKYDYFERFIPNPNFNSNDGYNSVFAIDESSNGDIYFLVDAGQLFLLSNNKIQSKLNLQQMGCKYLCIDNKDQCWLSVKDKVYQYDIKNNLTKEINVKFPDHVTEPEIKQLLVTDSLIYIASYKSDLVAYNYKTKQHIYFNLLDQIKNTYGLLKVDNTLYVGTGEGLKIINLKNNQVTEYKHDIKNLKSLNTNAIRQIFIDNQENIWLSSTNGVNVAFTNTGFKQYSYYLNNFDKDIGVNTFIKDNDNNLWIGYSEKGFEIFNHNYSKSYTEIEGIIPDKKVNNVFKIFQDRANNIWIGTYSKGLILFTPQTESFQQYHPHKKNDFFIEGEDIRDICEDPEGNLWIAVHGKGIMVKRKNNNQFLTLQNFNKNIPGVVNQPWVFDINFDPEGNLWLATSIGCYHYNFSKKTYEHYSQNSTGKYKISSNTVNAIVFDHHKNAWVATHNGINVLQNDTTFLIDEKAGLPNKQTSSIVIDDSDQVWASTINGIVRIDPKMNYRVTNFPTMKGANSSVYRPNASYKCDSMIFFGHQSGYTKFIPENINKPNIKPEVLFTDFYIFDKSIQIKPNNSKKSKNEFYIDQHISYYDKLTISSTKNLIGFEFTALNYNYSNNIVFSYKLEGFNSNWINTQNNQVFFTNLHPGEYTLKIKANELNSRSNEKYTSINLRIKPPFLVSKFALFMYATIIVLFLLYLRKLSFEREKMSLLVDQQNQLREIRTRFFMNISHELKTPITLISVPLKKIIEDYYTNNKPPSLHDMSLIFRNVNRILRIMNQIFDFRKIELKKNDLMVEKADIVSFTQAIIEYFDYQADKKNIKIETNFSDHQIPLLFDADKMDKIIFNLLSNSLKHTPENGKISITIQKQIKQGWKKNSNEFIKWIIRDTGPGIEESLLSGIFDRFSQSSLKSDIHKSGTGIGLSIVKEYTELHHGEISIQSLHESVNPNKSFTEIVLHFPINDKLFTEDQITSKNIASQIIEEHKKSGFVNQTTNSAVLSEVNFDEMEAKEVPYTVLIVDDETDVCDFLKQELSTLYKVYTSENGKKGLQLAQKIEPDIIISDIMMPEMDGQELCKTLKSDISTSHIPIILLTAKSSKDDEMEAYTTGADAFISKPFNMEMLKNRIETLITNRLELKKAFLSNYGIKLQNVVPTRTDEKLMQKLILFINENIAEQNLNVEMITNELGISRSQLYKKIKSVANTSVNLFIRTLRMKKAVQLLAEGNMNVTEVAYAVGFDNLPYFSKCFQEEYGISPSKYAKTHRT
ncbi:MAG: response regulator [Prolixibacteraceae bacterium]|nr:response regulator [Prolixibacteraceae bacterium]